MHEHTRATLAADVSETACAHANSPNTDWNLSSSKSEISTGRAKCGVREI